MVGAIASALAGLSGLTAKLIGNKDGMDGAYTNVGQKEVYEREDMTMTYIMVSLVMVAICFAIIMLIIKKT